jgi:hypothetical protein
MIDLPYVSLWLVALLLPLCIFLNFLVLYYWRSCLPFIIFYIAWMIASQNKRLFPPARISLIDKLWIFGKSREHFPASVILNSPQSPFSEDKSHIFLCYPHGNDTI